MPENEKKIQEEIGDILEGFVPVSEPVEPIKVEGGESESQGEKREEEKAGEQIGEPAASVKEEKGEVVLPVIEPVTAVPVEPVAPVAPVASEETVVDRITRENAELRIQLNEMAERYSGLSATRPAEQLTPEQKAAAPKQALRFIPDDETYDKVTSSADNFNILLTTVVNTAVNHALRMIPQVATNMVDQQISLKTSVDEFFKANSDLLPQRKYVGYITSEVTSEHPDWELGKIFDEVESRSRERLRLPKITLVSSNGTPVQNNTRTVQGSPAFVPSGGGGRRGSGVTETLTGQDKQIIDIIS